MNGFHLTGPYRPSRVFVFRRTHFDSASRSCDSYDSRPGMCRDYPRLLLWQSSPEQLPGCGHRAFAPNAWALADSLARLDLTESQRERLRVGLRLEDDDE